MQNTFYKIKSSAFSKDVRFAFISDLHAQDYRKALALTREAKPNYILLGGDIFEAITGYIDDENIKIKVSSEFADKIDDIINAIAIDSIITDKYIDKELLLWMLTKLETLH